ncbi:unnamed protein product [Spirodela intermedia]|uniref:Alanine racemase N-terminal domain-containing protein n=1 Tax=Spirodela intermedia TaxID=51605 RepID=A0ABN7EB11_SPIIN|nr:unnamed protein product [Spirodela intermedia]
MAAVAAAEGAAVTALRSVMQRVQQAAERAGRPAESVRVVAVSKTKPVSVIQQVYDAGHRIFGENYVQEILEKAPQLPDDIQWHYIGNLQSNKAKALLAGVPNLCMVQSVDDVKVAAYIRGILLHLKSASFQTFTTDLHLYMRWCTQRKLQMMRHFPVRRSAEVHFLEKYCKRT